MKMREQNKHNKRIEIEQFDWFIEQIQMRLAFGWLCRRLGEKNFMPKNYLEINRYFALMSYCSMIGERIKTISMDLPTARLLVAEHLEQFLYDLEK